ncbi:MAG: ATP-binding protein [Myxococcota bacterium]|nr:ATP-binding protein [Myxococcota bacterium]
MPDRSHSPHWLSADSMESRGGAFAALAALVVGWTIVACSLAGLLVAFVWFEPTVPELVAGAGALAAGAGTIVLARSGRWRFASGFAVCGVFVSLALGTFHSGNVLAPWSMGFFALVTLATLTLGGRAGAAATLASIACLAALAAAFRGEAAPPVDPAAVIVAQGIALLGVAFLLHFARARTEGALTAAERHERELGIRELELESVRERFQVLSESSQHLITELDMQGNVVYASPNHREVVGWAPEELIGRSWRKVIPPDLQVGADLAIPVQTLGAEMSVTTYRARHRDGSVLWLESRGRAFGAADGQTRLLAVTLDITQRVALETQLRQSQKLEAVGLLAGGVAHDFNNLLTVIDLNSELLLGEARFSGETALHEIREAGRRAQALTRQLLAFSRRRALRPRILDLDRTLSRVEGLLRRILGEHIEISFRPSLEPLHVFIDPTELEQVIVNLAVNARDAMPRGGRLEIATGLANRPSGAGDEKESWAVIEVRDEGEGMTPEVLSRLFEPFFTTKEVGQGSGLGLAVVHGIIEQSGGRVEVESESGVGTCFRISLRSVEAPASDELEAPAREPQTGGSETILIAEDDRMLRGLVCSILEDGGYRVIEAATGREALEAVERSEQGVDLLLTDLVMPEVDGRVLSARLAEISPASRTLFMSGHPDRGQPGAAQDDLPEGRVIAKPFTRGELLSTIRAVLDGQESGARA